MKKRIDSFSLLLGGVHEFDVEEVGDSDEKWRNEVIETAKRRLAEAGGQLREGTGTDLTLSRRKSPSSRGPPRRSAGRGATGERTAAESGREAARGGEGDGR